MRHAEIDDEKIGETGTTYVMVYGGDKPICEIAFDYTTNPDGSIKDYRIDTILVCGRNNCEPEPDGEAEVVYSIDQAHKINPEIDEDLAYIAELEFLKKHDPAQAIYLMAHDLVVSAINDAADALDKPVDDASAIMGDLYDYIHGQLGCDNIEERDFWAEYAGRAQQMGVLMEAFGVQLEPELIDAFETLKHLFS